jgi:hypothetical protein
MVYKPREATHHCIVDQEAMARLRVAIHSASMKEATYTIA